MMVAIKIYTLYLILPFLHGYGMSTAGQLFVISCPWVNMDTLCTAHMTTTEKMLKVKVSEVNGQSIFLLESFIINPSRPAKYQLGPLIGRGIQQKPKPLKNYPVRIFQSDHFFRVTVLTIDRAKSHGDTIVSMPKRSCFHSYYAITAEGGAPFVSVFSFDFQETNVQVAFPKNDVDFSIPCFANELCSSGGTVSFKMSKFSCWHFAHDNYLLRLQNIVVTADRPIHVVSGATNSADIQRGVLHKGGPDDWATTSLKASSTWGKVYIVPIASRFSFDYLRFVFSTIQIPLTVTFHEIHGSTKIERSYTIFSQMQIGNVVKYNDTIKNTLAVTADVPFGLYKIFYYWNPTSTSSKSESLSILNLIPVEQWLRGSKYIQSDLFDESKSAVIYDVIIEGRKEDLVVTPAAGVHFLWKRPDITINGKTYSVGTIVFAGENANLYVNTSSGKMILYTTYMSRTISSTFLATYPYDFNSAEIYQEDCKASKRFSSNDGIDNDCDGMVDEETKNGVDDDGDGRVDEDTVAAHSDGQWGSWYDICDHACDIEVYAVKVRRCLKRSAFGRECQGENILCNNFTCPSTCYQLRFTPGQSCFCRAGCASCERTTFKCDSCLPGYKPEDECLISCPDGSIGKTCPVTRGRAIYFLAIAIPVICVLGFFVAFLMFKNESGETTYDIPLEHTDPLVVNEILIAIRKYTKIFDERNLDDSEDGNDENRPSNGENRRKTARSGISESTQRLTNYVLDTAESFIRPSGYQSRESRELQARLTLRRIDLEKTNPSDEV